MTERGYCECGCGERTRLQTMNCATRGLIKGQPNRYVKGHQTIGNPHNYLVTEDGCWIWQGAVNNQGYSRLRIGRREWLAHRWHYVERFGPIPDGLCLDHLCRTPRCVNPDHLEPVTSAENAHRGQKARLTKRAVREILVSRENNTVLAHRFGVSQPTVCNVRLGKTWSNVHPELPRRQQRARVLRRYGVTS